MVLVALEGYEMRVDERALDGFVAQHLFDVDDVSGPVVFGAGLPMA